tara:strand:+ start:514 stop:690 length:177 start_codon:yes stop_codon:yes gene_type:complete
MGSRIKKTTTSKTPEDAIQKREKLRKLLASVEVAKAEDESSTKSLEDVNKKNKWKGLI